MKNMDTISVKRSLTYRQYSWIHCYSIVSVRMEFEVQPVSCQLGLCFSFPVFKWVGKNNFQSLKINFTRLIL